MNLLPLAHSELKRKWDFLSGVISNNLLIWVSWFHQTIKFLWNLRKNCSAKQLSKHLTFFFVTRFLLVMLHFSNWVADVVIKFWPQTITLKKDLQAIQLMGIRGHPFCINEWKTTDTALIVYIQHDYLSVPVSVSGFNSTFMEQRH